MYSIEYTINKDMEKLNLKSGDYINYKFETCGEEFEYISLIKEVNDDIITEEYSSCLFSTDEDCVEHIDYGETLSIKDFEVRKAFDEEIEWLEGVIRDDKCDCNLYKFSVN